MAVGNLSREPSSSKAHAVSKVAVQQGKYTRRPSPHPAISTTSPASWNTHARTGTITTAEIIFSGLRRRNAPSQTQSMRRNTASLPGDPYRALRLAAALGLLLHGASAIRSVLPASLIIPRAVSSGVQLRVTSQGTLISSGRRVRQFWSAT